MVNTEYNVGNWTHEGLNASLAESVPLMNSTLESVGLCHRDSSLLFLLLMLGTLWLGISLYNFNKTPYLQASKREALADYALPVAVVTLSLIGSFFFQDVYMEPFRYNTDNHIFKLVWIDNMPWQAVLCSIGLGFSLSILMLMDQNISSAMVNNPSNK
ncbi:unnamed protein product [Allacma fusca]|uniref:Bicarbonate transporter-like transmembrane domain-containing protein n=1 Tax=Allacma fusca TaxID=39272 RepID=A0A8J2KMA0_9HEXA|nr:unnamed protein product [Allacma fusca]